VVPWCWSMLGPRRGVDRAGRAADNQDVQEHRGNGEHPQSLERRRQLLVWRSLALLVLVGGVLGVLRLLVNLLEGAPGQSVAYQVFLLALNGLVGMLVVIRLRSLRRRR
jgi:hypothetical protein